MRPAETSPLFRREGISTDKKLRLSGWDVYWFTFLYTFILFPIWLGILLPLSLISLIISKILSCCSKPDIRSTFGELKTQSTVNSTSPRAYDLVLFGATGFTGKMAAVYLAKNYSTKLRWAISGRRRDALEKLKAELVQLSPELQDHLGIVIADSTDEIQLNEMVSNTKVVISTAGPFSIYGSLLVQLCAARGTHYCDITGETDWVREVIDRCEFDVKSSGAKIVHFCGHDCIPWDLIVQQCAKKLKERGETIKEIKLFDEIRADPSGGTLSTMLHALAQRVVYKSRLGFDPLLKAYSSSPSDAPVKSENKLIAANHSFSLSYSSLFRSWVGPFLMAPVMSNCVRRSNALLSYTPSSSLVYCESQVFPSFLAGYVTLFSYLLLGTCLSCPPLRWLMFALSILPNPGQGPTEKSMDEGFLIVTAIAKGTNDTLHNNQSELSSLSADSSLPPIRATFSFPTDPGYRDTARMLVESGLCLVFDEEETFKFYQHSTPSTSTLTVLDNNNHSQTSFGGVFTPASCMGESLLKRLVATGSSFHID